MLRKALNKNKIESKRENTNTTSITQNVSMSKWELDVLQEIRMLNTTMTKFIRKIDKIELRLEKLESASLLHN